MSTSLMPTDPALSPQQVSRLLPIRATLLPDEITHHRLVRRIRTIVIAGLVLVLVALGAWYGDAYYHRGIAKDGLSAVDGQIARANAAMQRSDLADVTKTTNQNKEVADQLKTLMANDLQWSVLINRLRTTGTASHVSISRITTSLADPKAPHSTSLSATTGTTVATLTIEGSGADKKTIAGFIDNLTATTGIANPFLTTVNQATAQNSKVFSFTANADVTSVALCGRFTTPCKTGGK